MVSYEDLNTIKFKYIIILRNDKEFYIIKYDNYIIAKNKYDNAIKFNTKYKFIQLIKLPSGFINESIKSNLIYKVNLI